MAAGDYSTAAEAYAECIRYLEEKKKKGEVDPDRFLIYVFNQIEATRRAKKASLPDLWSQIIDLFDHAGETSAAPLVLQANRWQAMHIPFALTGNAARAREALTKARKAAELLGPAEDIFTVKTYREVPVKEFLQINDEMLAALDQGQLWDGMPLPPASPASANAVSDSRKTEPENDQERR